MADHGGDGGSGKEQVESKEQNAPIMVTVKDKVKPHPKLMWKNQTRRPRSSREKMLPPGQVKVSAWG